MSGNKEDLLDIAAQAEQDLNTHEAKVGHQQGTGFGGGDPKSGSLSSACWTAHLAVVDLLTIYS